MRFARSIWTDAGKRNLRIAAGTAILLALALRLAFFAVSVQGVPASSDETLSLLQAERSILHGRFPLLVMANPYQFPVESYAVAPFVKLLPHTAFGARVIPFGLCLAATAVFLLIARRMWPPGIRWPGMVLILFPSAYLLMLCSAYFIPQHSSLMLLFALAILLTLLSAEEGRRGTLWWAGAAGFVGALTVSNHLLGLPVLAMTGALVCLGRGWKDALRRTPAFLAGAFIGIAPYLLATYLYPGAYDEVCTTIHPFKALAHLWSPLLTWTLPGAFGINPCVFPDTKKTLDVLPHGARVFLAFWALVLLAATALRAWSFVRRTARTQWPSLEAADLWVGICWLMLGLAMFNSRSLSHSYRHLLPLVWSFPFLAGAVYAAARSGLRGVMGALVVLLVGLNVATGIRLIQRWDRPGFGRDEANIYDIRPAVRYLQERGINRCYASYWAAYRINYETAGAVTCSQPINERFPRWPVPYKDTVDASTNAAYVLAPRLSLLPASFEADIAAMGVICRKQVCGDFTVYTDFRLLDPPREVTAPVRAVAASVEPDQAERMKDGDHNNWWESGRHQERGMWIEARLHSVLSVCRVSTYYGGRSYFRAKAVDILAWVGGEWQTVRTNVVQDLARFQFVNNHPVYGDGCRTYRFEPVETDAVRVWIAEAAPTRQWSVAEIEVGFVPTADGLGSDTRESM